MRESQSIDSLGAACPAVRPPANHPAKEKRPRLTTGVPSSAALSLDSAAQTQLADQVGVAGFVLALQVVQQLAALRDQLQQTTTRMVVFLVGLEVLGQGGNARRQDRHLHFGEPVSPFLVANSVMTRFFSSTVIDIGISFQSQRVMAQAGMSSSTGPWRNPPKRSGGCAAIDRFP